MGSLHVSGLTKRWRPKGGHWMWQQFDFDVPDGHRLHYETNQATLLVKDSSGNSVVAIRDVNQFSTSGLEVIWTAVGEPLTDDDSSS